MRYPPSSRSRSRPSPHSARSCCGSPCSTNASGNPSWRTRAATRRSASATLPADTLIVGHTEGYKTFDDGSNFASETDLANLSDLNVVYGYGAYGMLDDTVFVKLSESVVPLEA